MADWQRDGENWSVSIDASKNRLYLALTGHVGEAEAAAAADATIEGAERLDGGFDLVTDLSDFQPGDPEAMKHVERGRKGVAANGVSAAVRVTDESTTGQMQFDRAGEDAESYQLAMADSTEKAEKLLDERRKQEA